MNGNPLYHWIGLGIATALLVPMPAAMLLGWVPPWQKKYAAGVRLRACALLCIGAGWFAGLNISIPLG